MTFAELQQIASDVAAVPTAQLQDLTNLIYDAFAAEKDENEMGEIKSVLYEAGVDVDGLCRKKHPPAPGT